MQVRITMELLEKSIFDNMKVVQYQDIPIVKDMECPDCHKSDVGGFFHERAKPIGWCDTQAGFMGSLNVLTVSPSSAAISVRLEDIMRTHFIAILL